MTSISWEEATQNCKSSPTDWPAEQGRMEWRSAVKRARWWQTVQTRLLHRSTWTGNNWKRWALSNTLAPHCRKTAGLPLRSRADWPSPHPSWQNWTRSGKTKTSASRQRWDCTEHWCCPLYSTVARVGPWQQKRPRESGRLRPSASDACSGSPGQTVRPTTLCAPK